MKWFKKKETERDIDVLELDSLDVTQGNFMLCKDKKAFKWYALQCDIYCVYKVDDMLYFFTDLALVGVKEE